MRYVIGRHSLMVAVFLKYRINEMCIGVIETLMLPAVGTYSAGFTIARAAAMYILGKGSGHQHLACARGASEQYGMGYLAAVGEMPQRIGYALMPGDVREFHNL